MSTGYYESALLRLRRITAYLNLRYADVIKEHDLTPVQFEILLYVDANPTPPRTISDIAEFMLVDRSTSSRVLKGMQDKGLLQVTFDQEDRRCRRVNLTPISKNLVGKYRSAWLGVEKAVRGAYNVAIEHLERF